MTVDPKPASRQVASLSDWEKLRRQKLGPCRICGGVPSTLHHLIPRSLRGDDVAENLVSLCGHGTGGHHGLIEAMDMDARTALRHNLRPDELRYVLRKRGSEFLDRYLPL